MKVYVCGGSSELDLVTDYMTVLAHMGHEITHDWARVIRERGEANPRNDTHEQRLAYGAADLRGIMAADLVWIIMPAKTSFGCAFEAGNAYAKRKVVIFSGDWRSTIFSAQARARFDNHADALRWITVYSDPAPGYESEMCSLEAK